MKLPPILLLSLTSSALALALPTPSPNDLTIALEAREASGGTSLSSVASGSTALSSVGQTVSKLSTDDRIKVYKAAGKTMIPALVERVYNAVLGVQPKPATSAEKEGDPAEKKEGDPADVKKEPAPGGEVKKEPTPAGKVKKKQGGE
jgi:hypothetical protein